MPTVVLVLPVCSLLVWLLHRLQSPGPLFCVQQRIGRYGCPFKLLKFRTMHVGHGCEPMQCIADDPRVYPAGRWLRRSSIDELPQFINVIRGEMSVVGPRPYLPAHDEAFARGIPDYRRRSAVQPGITGLGQVAGLRGELRTQEDVVRRFDADITYIQKWSFWLDCWLVLKTVPQMMFPPSTAI